jgi:hypothetical protein
VTHSFLKTVKPVIRLLTVSLLLVASAPLFAQWFDWNTPGIPRTDVGRVNFTAPAPRTNEGQTDFSGLWVPTDARGSLFDSTNIQDWALDVMTAQQRDFFRNEPRFHCLPDGPASYPAGSSVGGTRRLVQSPTFIAELRPDMMYRQIFLDGRELVENPLLPTWMGYSAAHWERDVLVVESNGFNDKTWLTREGLPHTDQLRITERYHRPDFGHIELEVIYEDPGTFKETAQAFIDLIYRADTDILEVACNESETAQSHYSGQLTQTENKNIEISEAILETYLGVYEGFWLGNPISAEVTLEDGELYLTRTPRYSDTGGNTDSATSLLTAQSENAFDSTFGLGWVFNTNENGEVISVSEVHVSGAWTFERVE